MPALPFSSPAQFSQFFIKNLARLLAQQEIGTFILVLANALSRQQIHDELKLALQQRFEQISQQLKTASDAEKNRLAKDDFDVFRKLAMMDLTQLSASQSRLVGHWQLQYHPLRSLRPPRNSAQPVTRLQQPFDNDAFHFNKPFLRKEILWQGTIGAAQVRLLYNKFPFADFHGLMVVEADACKPQFLQQADCQTLQHIHESLAKQAAMGMAYNSLGAHASVNHQHWQTFCSATPYPIEQADWQHNGGSKPYPLAVEQYETLPRAWPEIDRLQRHNQAFNLFLNHGKLWLIKRNRQGEYQAARWTEGFAWSETAGALMVNNPQDFQALNESQITQALLKLT